MVRFTVLASGSKGNSSIVTHCPDGFDRSLGSDSCTRILVDAGLSCRELFRRMRMIGEDPATLDAIVVTHEHQDHISGLSAIARKLGIPVYFTEATHRAWVRQVTPRRKVSYAAWAELYRRRKEAADAIKLKPDFDAACDLISDPRSDVDSDLAFVPKSERSIKLGASPQCLPPSFEIQHCGIQPESDTQEKNGPESEDLESDSVHFQSQEFQSPQSKTIEVERLDPARLPAVQYFRAGEAFTIGDIGISPFTIPHDAADPVGFVFSAEGVRLAVATDLGYLPPNVQAQLRRCDLILLESNHDLEMLRDGPYPWSVKQRVLSRVGHLSNDATSNYLEQSYDGSATYLILAHLSESNNMPELARISAERALVSKPNLLANRLLLAHQHNPLEPVCF